jgi:hypothetical protein
VHQEPSLRVKDEFFSLWIDKDIFQEYLEEAFTEFPSTAVLQGYSHMAQFMASKRLALLHQHENRTAMEIKLTIHYSGSERSETIWYAP